MQNRLQELLPEPSGIKTDIVIERSLVGAAPELLARAGLDGRLLIVCDTHTEKAMAKRLAEETQARLLMLPGKVQANEAALAQIRAEACDAIIAVGSGTINDLCKYASAQDGKPYAVFPTAPSMNGYLSANASLTLAGVKESRKAQLPKGVFCDLRIIAAAPARLIRSGLGDSLCRPTAQADWLLSHHLLGTPYSGTPFRLLAPYEAELFAHADKLTAGDLPVIELLMHTLLVSGLGMTLAGGSMPASQGEHMIAHTMEMRHEGALPETYHGEQIGVTTLTMAKLQEEMLSRPLRLPPLPLWEGELAEHFGRKKARLIAEHSYRKYALCEDYDMIAARLEANEAEIRDRIRNVALPESRLRQVLEASGAPATPEALGWSRADYNLAVRLAPYTRDRFTFLDLA